MTVRDTSGPVAVMRYNMYSASAITGNPAPGSRPGQAINLMQVLANRALPESMASEWTELTYLQLQAGNQAIFVFAPNGPWCSSSWCWPPSTKAGRCPWP